MEASGITEEKAKGANLPLIIGFTFVLSFLFAFGTSQLVIHQNHFYSMLINERGFGVEGSELQNLINGFMAQYGNNFRTYKHRLLDGLLSGMMLFLPMVAVNTLFERKSWNYILINSEYWILSMIMIGGLICR